MATRADTGGGAWHWAALWFGVAAPPTAWFLHLVVSYGLGAYFCTMPSLWLLHGVTAATAALAIAGVLVSWRKWRETRAPAGEPRTSGGAREAATGEGGGASGASRALALGGLALGLYFTAVVLFEALSNLFLDPCAGG